MYMYTHMHVVTINKRGHEFEGDQRGYMGEFGDRKGKREILQFQGEEDREALFFKLSSHSMEKLFSPY